MTLLSLLQVPASTPAVNSTSTGSITDIGNSFINVIGGLLSSFGLPQPLSTLLSIFIIVGVAFFIFLSLINDLDIPQNMRTPVYLSFVAILFVIGVLPIWIIGIIMIVGLLYVFWRVLVRMGTGGSE